MKVVCTQETYKGHSLTYGKVYEVIEQLSITTTSDHYRIIDNNGILVWYNNEVVIPIDEWRNKQLNELGIC